MELYKNNFIFSVFIIILIIAGSLTFLRSMLCTFSNNCYDEPQNPSGFIASQFQELNYEEYES